MDNDAVTGLPATHTKPQDELQVEESSVKSAPTPNSPQVEKPHPPENLSSDDEMDDEDPEDSEDSGKSNSD